MGNADKLFKDELSIDYVKGVDEGTEGGKKNTGKVSDIIIFKSLKCRLVLKRAWRMSVSYQIRRF